MADRAESFEDHYRTRDGKVLFVFRFRCDAGSSAWQFAVKYGDVRITHTPSAFHDPGLLLYADGRPQLLDEAARWAEKIYGFYGPAESLQAERTSALEQVHGHS